MASTQNENRRLFVPDDYASVQGRFRELRVNGQIDADPSGWRSTYSEAETLLPTPVIGRGDLSQYHLDAVLGLSAHRDAILSLLAAWEDRDVSSEEVTICPSGTIASLAILSVLKGKGVRHIRFETPAFFASIEQARSIGMEVDLIATYRRELFRTPFAEIEASSEWQNRRHAVWFTQPRAALGFNQPIDEIGRLTDSLDQRSQFVVVDEVTDQLFPARLSILHRDAPRPNLIRIRSFTKGMGLNGVRLSAVLHPPELRKAFIEAIDALGGSVDAYSLATIAELAKDQQRFRRMLAAANRQVTELRIRAARAAAGSPVEVNKLENGYIGSMSVDLSSLGADYGAQRERFLEECVKARTPVVLAASYKMALDPPNELIRLNFFISPDSVLRGVSNIVRILSR
jgi:DNA-binding transcriptional MocR family regulator